MDATDFQREVRNVLALSDELSRHEHALGDSELAGHLGAARTALGALDRVAGKSHRRRMRANPADVGALARTVTLVRHRAGRVPEPLRARLAAWAAGIDRVVFAARRPASSVPSKPLFGRLPLFRLVSQDLHSMLDYAAAAAYVVTALLAKDRDARAASVFLAADLAGISLSSDVRLAVARRIPVELHELLDHASGVFAMVAPFVLRYARKDPRVAAVHVATGAITILASLATDYRAMRGVSRARRSKGGPRRRLRVPDAQRPLEGLAAPSYF